MQYLIITKEHNPFLTNWYQYENHWVEGSFLMVFDTINYKYTKNGKDWLDIELDHL